ncbi:MAG: hypothetical protein Q7S31_00035 [bacterium]|nr:hypothetical protein [bacterium]
MPDVYIAHKKTPPSPEKKPAPPVADNRWWKEVIGKVLNDAGEQPRRAVGGAYCVYPGIRFINQQQDEEIVLLLRAHPITNLGWILITLAMLVLPTLLLATGMFASVPGKFILVGRFVWYVMAFAFAFEKFLYWYYSVFLVTNERLVDIDFPNFLQREVTFANLNHIEEPESIIRGFIRSVLRYGDVNVTTASERPSIEAIGVPYPDKVVDIINRLAEELEKRRERGE